MTLSTTTEERTMQDVTYTKFELSIDLGNDAMQAGPDVADALRRVADRIEHALEARGNIRDLNGSTVGSFGPHNEA